MKLKAFINTLQIILDKDEETEILVDDLFEYVDINKIFTYQDPRGNTIAVVEMKYA